MGNSLKSIMCRVCFIVTAMFAACSMANAATVSLTPEMQAYLVGAEYSRALVQKLNESFQSGLKCGPKPQANTKSVTIFQPVEMSAGKPVKGVWKVAVAVQGCANVQQLNVGSEATKAGVRLFNLFPGTTIADPRLQRDAFLQADIAARTSSSGKLLDPQKECTKTARVFNTVFGAWAGVAGKDVPTGREARPWREGWMLDICGRWFIVNILFTPDTTGTRVHASVNEPPRPPR